MYHVYEFTCDKLNASPFYNALFKPHEQSDSTIKNEAENKSTFDTNFRQSLEKITIKDKESRKSIFKSDDSDDKKFINMFTEKNKTYYLSQDLVQFGKDMNRTRYWFDDNKQDLDTLKEKTKKVIDVVSNEILSNKAPYTQGQMNGELLGKYFFGKSMGVALSQLGNDALALHETLVSDTGNYLKGIPYINSKDQLCSLTVASLPYANSFAVWVVENTFGKVEDRKITVLSNIGPDIFQKEFLKVANLTYSQNENTNLAGHLKTLINNEDTYEDLMSYINNTKPHAQLNQILNPGNSKTLTAKEKEELQQQSKLYEELVKSQYQPLLAYKNIQKKQMVAAAASSVISLASGLTMFAMGFGPAAGAVLGAISILIAALLAVLAVYINKKIEPTDLQNQSARNH